MKIYLSSIRFFVLLLYTVRGIQIRTSPNPTFSPEQREILAKIDTAPQQALHDAALTVISGLSTLRQEVVKRVCGIDTDPMTYEDLGKEKKRTREAIRRQFMIALRQCYIPEHRKPIDEVLYGSQPVITLESPLSSVEWPGLVETFILGTGFTTFGELAAKSTAELRKFRHGGKKVVSLISCKLEMLGFHLRDRAPVSDSSSTEEVLALPIEMLGLSVRALTVCEKRGVVTIKDVTKLTEHWLYCTRNCGRKTINEIKEKLSQRGMSLGMVYLN